MKPAQIISTIALLSACTSAWPWPPSIPRGSDGVLIPQWISKRQDNGNGGNTPPADNNNNNNNNADPAPPADTSNGNSGGDPTGGSSADSGPTPTDSGNGGNGGDNTATPTPTDGPTTGNPDGKGDASGTITKKPETTLAPINLQDPPGGISMVSPNVMAGAQYYKIGATKPITFAWNYTSLLRPPAAINVLATASAPTPGVAAPSPFTIAANLSFDATQTVTWDTNEFTSSVPLPMGTYTLIVYDAAAKGGATAIPKPGYLGTNQQFTFGMYYPQPTVVLSNPYVCATCNAAGGNIERLKLGFLFSMCGITIASFLWYGSAFAGFL